MKEFMMAALPWICIGIAIALFAANHGTVKKAKDGDKHYGNYMTEGMWRLPKSTRAIKRDKHSVKNHTLNILAVNVQGDDHGNGGLLFNLIY